MLILQLAHLFEEIWGQFRGIEILGGLGWFLVLNWVLFFVVLTIFYFILLKKRWAYYIGMIYAGIMILNGIVHNIATMVTGKYFGGYAGGYSGLGLIVIGPILIYFLRKGLLIKLQHLHMNHS